MRGELSPNFFSDPLDFNGAKTDETWILKVYTMQKTVNSEQISQHCNHRFRGSSMNKTWQFLYLWFFMDEFSSNVDGDTSMNQHSKGSPVRVPRHHPLLPPAFFFSRQSGGYASFKSGSTVSCNADHNKLFPWDICANNFNHNCSWKQRFETMK